MTSIGKPRLSQLLWVSKAAVIVLFLLAPRHVLSAPYDYALIPSASRLHLSLGCITSTNIRFDQTRAHSQLALSGGFGFEVPIRYPLAWAIDADLHDLSAFESHTRFLALSTGVKYAFSSLDRQITFKPLATLGIGYFSDSRMPIQRKTVVILRTGLDLNVATDAHLKWLFGGSVLWFPQIIPGDPRVHFSPVLLFRFGIII